MAKQASKKVSKKKTAKKQNQVSTVKHNGIETSMDLLVAGILLGKKIAKDGLNKDDLASIPEVVDYVKGAASFFASKPALLEEFKALPKDYLKAIRLIQKAYESFKMVTV